MAELTPQQWFDKLNSLFTTPTRQRWQDRRLRPHGRDNERASYGPVARECTPRDQLYDTLWSYFVGDPPLPQVAEQYQEIFRDVMRKSRSNYAPMCVAAMQDRMELQAVSTLDDADTDGDSVAADIMEESGFGAVFKDFLGYLFAMSEAYLMAVPGDPQPTIHAIDPRRCVGVPDRDNPTRLAAALVKEYDYIDSVQVSYLFLPGEKYELRSLGTGLVKWQFVDETPELISNLDVLGGIPIVRFDNAHGIGEYEPHIDLLDRINDTTLQRICIAWYQAFRQRALIGDVEEEDDDEPGTDPFDWSTSGDTIFKADPGSLWKVPEGFTFWESQPTDLGPLLIAKRNDVEEFAAVTSTPLHLITPDAANGSAEGAGLMRESATSKVRDRRERVTPGLRLLWRIAFALAGEAERGRKMRFTWGPIEFRTLAEQASASAQAAGTLSLEQRCKRIWQMSPEETQNNIVQLTADRLLEAPPPTPGPPGQPQQPAQSPRESVA